MHSPKGSNNRLNEQNQNRDNNNRLFDSQNNNKGGYSVGVDEDIYADSDDVDTPLTGPEEFENMNNDGYDQEPATFFSGSVMDITWTNQHACGPNYKDGGCEIVIQYMCDDEAGAPQLRDGEQTGCPNNNDQCPPLDNDEDVNDDTFNYEYGQHETVWYYQDCRTRERNAGLFTADQNLNGNEARFTRQNPNGGRSGTECPEERDYYPYWHPSPWRDIAVLTSDLSRCPMYQAESQNVMNKGNCTVPEHNNQNDCEGDGGTWQMVGAFNMAAPECLEVYWTRDNHLGNVENGHAASYNWTLPALMGTGHEYGENNGQTHEQFDRCVIRMRYNISTADVADENGNVVVADFWDLDANYNDDDSPIQQNQNVGVPGADDVGEDDIQLQQAINTNQYGRTFQDRSYVFHIEDAKSVQSVKKDCNQVHNLNARGKRGNIVQSYPAVEHDFIPNILVADVGDCIHFQYFLTDNDPNANNGNNNGEGRDNTGRVNFAIMTDGGSNQPLTSFDDQNFFDTPEQMFKWSFLEQTSDNSRDIDCLGNDDTNNDNEDQNPANCAVFNARGPYYNGGTMTLTKTGEWEYESTRDNNFSNRSTKGMIIVTNKLSQTEKIILGLGLGLGGSLIATIACFFGLKRAGKVQGPADFCSCAWLKGAGPKGKYKPVATKMPVAM